jgi:streptogramin lyase
MLIRRRPSAPRLIALAVASVAAMAVVLGAMLSAAHAASLFGFTQFKVPTTNSEPRYITVGSDRNVWFTEGNEFFTPNPDPHTGGPSTATSVGSPQRARSPSFASRTA